MKLAYKFIKRVLDVVFAILLFPLFIILIIPIGILIYREDSGPIFYISNRIGLDNKMFKMLKFRTMKVNAEDIRLPDGATSLSKNDNRLTFVGKILREASLDEIPQILNVLTGDMSIIGPRPDVPTDAGKNQFRLKVRPGITGLSQAYYRNQISRDKKIEVDSYYQENISLSLDFKIFFKTISTLVSRSGIYKDSL